MIRKLPNLTMTIAPDAWIAENTSIIGQVEICPQASIWYGAVLRGDAGAITIGCRSAIEDNVTIHGAVSIGENVIVGHNAVIHNCTLKSGCLIGMNATVLSGAVIGEGALVAAGALVPENMHIPEHSVVKGVPGRIITPITEEQRLFLETAAEKYLEYAQIQLPLWKELSSQYI